ncbi:metallophosphoesterase [Anaerocolumna sp. MB42-C2]|uniref:metallophosphoesterase n=1 Tax=Anaerocolumna sp. MB42-C2 TaxID=3070997 RepID=UPI0027DF0A96|nr:metallophosphoesterase [Anaerocolumna sp. MB42-C2]WMJ88227.1 metallophosphoesterase [Anaerocolumna sp. MB42-C2]
MNYTINKRKTRNLVRFLTVFLMVLLLILLARYFYFLYFPKDNTQYSRNNSDKDQTFYIASDVHYLSEKLTDHGIAFEKYISSGDGKQLNYIDSILKAFITDIKKTKPDFLIISGDLTNNGEKESHLDLSRNLKTIEKNGTSVFVIPGNHDINNPWARQFKGEKQYLADCIFDKDFSKIYADFGYDEAISRDEESLSYLAAPTDKLWLLMLDTNKYKDNLSVGIPSADGLIKQGTYDWILKCLESAKKHGSEVIAVMHHNILDHSEVIRDGYTLNNHGQISILFKEYQVQLVLSGHIHVQDISSDHKAINPLYDIASGALSVYPFHYGILKYYVKSNSLKYFTKTVDVENWAKNNHIKDKNLLNFNRFSKEYFGNASSAKISKSLQESGYTNNQIKRMLDILKTLNIRYFSGTENLNEKDLLHSEGYRLLTELPDSFLKSYVTSIISDKDIYDNELTVDFND